MPPDGSILDRACGVLFCKEMAPEVVLKHKK